MAIKLAAIAVFMMAAFCAPSHACGLLEKCAVAKAAKPKATVTIERRVSQLERRMKVLEFSARMAAKRAAAAHIRIDAAASERK